jgi:hypothetical protein
MACDNCESLHGHATWCTCWEDLADTRAEEDAADGREVECGSCLYGYPTACTCQVAA